MEYEMCFTFEPGKDGKCIGSSGRKLRRVCIYCPNWIHYHNKQEREKAKKGKENDDRGLPGCETYLYHDDHGRE